MYTDDKSTTVIKTLIFVALLVSFYILFMATFQPSSKALLEQELKAEFNKAVIKAGGCSWHAPSMEYNPTCLKCVEWYGKNYNNVYVLPPKPSTMAAE